MDRQYFKEYYRLERSHWWFLVRKDIILSLIANVYPHRSDLRILNVGAATGYSSEFLSKFGKVTSIEYDEACCLFAKEELQLEFIQGSVTDLPFQDGEFDLVCAFDVVEHVEDHKKAVEELKRVTRKEGKLVVTVPAFMLLWSRHDVVNQHFRRYRKCELVGLFSPSGSILRVGYFNFILFFPIALFRLVSWIIPVKENPDADFGALKGSGVSALLKALFRLEVRPIRMGVNFPVGVSAYLVWKKA
jgi:SAM-dependent methyltransferase